MTENEQDRTERFARTSRRFVFYASYVLAAGVVVAFLAGRPGLGWVLVGVIFVLLWARGGMTIARGMKAVRQREKAVVPAAPVAAAAGPVPVDQVIAALVGMNSDGLPYVIESVAGPKGPRVEVRWKIEELRWETLFTKGEKALMWRMEVDLDPSSGHYRFVEYSGLASRQAVFGPGALGLRADWTWSRGKTAHQTNASFFEGADGQVQVVSTGEERTSWEGAIAITPGDAKKPVFTVLRTHGWTPRLDWAGARLFEH